MKITNIKTFIYHTHWNWLFVKMETDEGITGWGEATTHGQEKSVEATIHNLKEYLIGKDPRHIEKHWSTMFRNAYWRPSFIITSAMSGVEMAMWDILGKSLGVPVYTLLGGPCREHIQIYHNGWWFKAKTLDDYVRLAKETVDKGAMALKWDPLWLCDVFPNREQIQSAIENVRVVREAVGDDVELMIDCHGRLNPNRSIQLARELEEFRPFWYEEPIPTDASVTDLAMVASSINIPVCVGERIPTRWCFRDIFEKRATAIINPDIGHAGGILETKKIADMAHAYYISSSPHSAGGPMLNAASVHLDASTPNFLIHEFFSPDIPFYEEILAEPFPIIKDGFIELPTKPGLGLEIKEEALSRRPYVFHDLSGFWAPPTKWATDASREKQNKQ